jgi:hypothetical protein
MDADAEHHTHLGCRVAARQQAEDLPFSHAELISRAVEPDRVVHDRARHAAVEVSLAPPDRPDPLQQLARVSPLDDVAVSARDQRLANGLRPPVHGQDDDPKGRMERPQGPEQWKPVAVGQGQVKEQHIRTSVRHEVECLELGGSLPDDLQVVDAAQKEPQTFSHDIVIVDERDPDTAGGMLRRPREASIGLVRRLRVVREGT